MARLSIHLPDELQELVWEHVLQSPWYHMMRARLKGRLHRPLWYEYETTPFTWILMSDWHRRLRGDYTDIAWHLGIDLFAAEYVVETVGSGPPSSS